MCDVQNVNIRDCIYDTVKPFLTNWYTDADKSATGERMKLLAQENTSSIVYVAGVKQKRNKIVIFIDVLHSF